MTHEELISYGRSYDQTSQGEMAIALERARQEHVPMLIQALLENSLRRIDALQILASWPVNERKSVFKLALSSESVWEKINESDMQLGGNLFLNEMVIFAHDLGVATDAKSLMTSEQRKLLLGKIGASLK